MTLVFVGHGILGRLKTAKRVPKELFGRDLAAELPGEEPIVIEHIHEFLSWHFYSPRSARYRFLVDPEVGTKEAGGGSLNHAIMSGLRRRFPARFQGVMPTEEFFRGASSFYVRHIPGYQWYPMRLQSNRSFTVQEMPDNLLHVRRAAP